MNKVKLNESMEVRTRMRSENNRPVLAKNNKN